MSLSPAQLVILKADILVNVNPVAGGTPVKNVPNTSDGNAAVADWYNLLTAAFTVWRDLPAITALDSVVWANMTPKDAVPTDTALNVAIWQSRSLACQGKQFNLQLMTAGRDTLPMKRTNYRTGMQDALTGLPAGVGGALISAGWVAVQTAAKFLATNVEKLLATGTGTALAPADLGFEGAIDYHDVESARNS